MSDNFLTVFEVLSDKFGGPNRGVSDRFFDRLRGSVPFQQSLRLDKYSSPGALAKDRGNSNLIKGKLCRSCVGVV